MSVGRLAWAGPPACLWQDQRGEVVAVIQTLNKANQKFTGEDMNLLKDFATHAEIALQVRPPPLAAARRRSPPPSTRPRCQPRSLPSAPLSPERAAFRAQRARDAGP